jgi:hypothetical protein
VKPKESPDKDTANSSKTERIKGSALNCKGAVWSEVPVATKWASSGEGSFVLFGGRRVEL